MTCVYDKVICKLNIFDTCILLIDKFMFKLLDKI